MRCDAQMPICTRCEAVGNECIYLESRRGYKGRAKCPKITKSTNSGVIVDQGAVANHPKPPVTINADTAQDQNDNSLTAYYPLLDHLMLHADGPNTAQQDLPTVTDSNQQHDRDESASATPRNHSSPPTWISGDLVSSALGVKASRVVKDYFIDIFYDKFYAAHPFVIPHKLFRENSSILPSHLMAVMRFIGSSFEPLSPRLALRHAANRVLSDTVPEDGFKVQGLILYAISLFAAFEPGEAAQALDKAVKLALKLGMNRWDFSVHESMGNRVLEESWRRTWWDLYILDSLAYNMTHALRLQAIATDVPLPCKCSDYVQCEPPLSSRTLAEMQNRTFVDDGFSYSSFAYKVEATRIMLAVLGLGDDPSALSNQQVETTDAALSSYLLSLPPDKREIVERDGKVDEMLFGAHMIVNWAVIDLHNPRSGLVLVRNHYPTACKELPSGGMAVSEYAVHTSKALRAANNISKMTAIQSPIVKHTPCFNCAIAHAATVHIPAYILEGDVDKANAIKERLQLALNAFTTISEVWPLARTLKGEVSQFARDLFTAPPCIPTAPQTITDHHMKPINPSFTASEDPWLDDLYFSKQTGSNFFETEHCATPFGS